MDSAARAFPGFFVKSTLAVIVGFAVHNWLVVKDSSLTIDVPVYVLGVAAYAALWLMSDGKAEYDRRMERRRQDGLESPFGGTDSS